MNSLFEKCFGMTVAFYAKSEATCIKDIFMQLCDNIDTYNLEIEFDNYENFLDIYDLNEFKKELNEYAETKEAGYFIISKDIYEKVDEKLKKISKSVLEMTKCKINQFDKILNMFNNHYEPETNIGQYIGYSICYYEPLGNELIPPGNDGIYIKGNKLKHYNK